MAAAFCNLSPGSGLKRLNDYLIHESYTTRYYLSSKRSACFFCNGGKLSLSTYRRQLKVKKRHQARRVLLASKEDNSGTNNEEQKEDDVSEATLINEEQKEDNVSKATLINEEQKEDNVSKATLIWRAVKLPIYSVALVPLSVGSAAAFFQMGICSARRYFVLLASSVLIITWLNLSNDVYDYDTGVDKDKKESVVNLVGWRTGTLIAAYLFLALGFMGLTWASMEAGSMRSIILLACAIICGYIYQCPPFRLGYQGLGEPLCFAAFGPFATTAFYLLQGSTSVTNYLPLSGAILSASVLVGLTTALILFCSHFHQVEGDRAVGKMSPLVRLGTRGGSKVVKVAVIALYFFLFAFGLIKALPFPSVLLCASTLPIGKMVVRFVEDNHKDKEKIFMAKYYCVRLHTLFGTALASGLVVARMINKEHVPKLIFS